MPPSAWASAMMCRQTVVLPEPSGPKTSITRPRGIPPTPSAMSSASDPVGITDTPAPAGCSPSFMTAPLPNCFSICWSVTSSILSRSTLASFSLALWPLGPPARRCRASSSPVGTRTLPSGSDITYTSVIRSALGRHATRTRVRMQPSGSDAETSSRSQRGRSRPARRRARVAGPGCSSARARRPRTGRSRGGSRANAEGNASAGSLRATVRWALNGRASGGNSRANALRTAAASPPIVPGSSSRPAHSTRARSVEGKAPSPRTRVSNAGVRSGDLGELLLDPRDQSGDVDPRNARVTCQFSAAPIEPAGTPRATAAIAASTASRSPRRDRDGGEQALRLRLPSRRAIGRHGRRPGLRRCGRRPAATRPRGSGARGRAPPARPSDGRAPGRPARRTPRACVTSSASSPIHTVPGLGAVVRFGTGGAGERDRDVGAEQPPGAGRHLERALATHDAGPLDRLAATRRARAASPRPCTRPPTRRTTFEAPGGASDGPPTLPPVSDSAHASASPGRQQQPRAPPARASRRRA